MQNLKRSINQFALINRSKSWSHYRFCTTTSESRENIEIPNYIPRSPTAILRALSHTVGFDHTAAHYKYHDDPYLIPLSNISKRSFALAQESGRKSAKWIRQQHSKLFDHKEADPPIEAFMPTKIYTAESEVDISDLKSLIEHSQVTDAILVYSLLKNKSAEIPNDLNLSFLELICFHNCEEPLDEDLIEERWFRQSERSKERPRKTWKDNDLAEQIFHEIEPKDSKVYSCIIRGMCKYYQVEKAWAIFQDCLSNNITLDVAAFNSLLNVVTVIKESAELRWKLILELLTHMKNQNINPNLGTMNACLHTISNMGVKEGKEYATSILTEFKKIGIEPSLGSWYYILKTYCNNNRGPVSHVLVDIMAEIEGKEFQIKDIKDTLFFVTAMDVCRNHLFDLSLAKRVDALLHYGENFNLIGDSFKESTYYRHYFSLLVQNEPIEVFMSEYYDQLVPHVYIPEPMVMEEILKAVELSGTIEHIPLLWSHMICFEQINRENLLNTLVRIMIQKKPDVSIKTQEKLTEQFGAIAFDIWTKIEEKNEMRSKPMIWSGKLLGDILILLCRINDIEKASAIMDKLSNDQQKVLGEPEFTAMQDFVKLCVVKKQPSTALQCLQYCSSIGFIETRDLAKVICQGFTLDENHMKKIAYLVGADVIEEVEREKQNAFSENLKQ